MTAGPYADLVATHGLSAAHRIVLEEVPDGARVLDVGCATGYLAAELSRRGCTIDGIEFDPVAAQAARAHCREVVIGDLEAPATRAEVERMLADARPNVVICADVLEHLRDPWAVLAWLRTLLAPGGRAVVSSRTSRIGPPAGRCCVAVSTTPTTVSWTARTCASSRARAQRNWRAVQGSPSGRNVWQAPRCRWNHGSQRSGGCATGAYAGIPSSSRCSSCWCWLWINQGHSASSSAL